MIALNLSTPKKVIKKSKSKLKTLLVFLSCIVIIGLYALPSFALGPGVGNSILSVPYTSQNLSMGNFIRTYNLTQPGIAFGAYKKPNSSAWSFADWLSPNNPTLQYDTITGGNKFYCLCFNMYQRDSSSFYRANYYIDTLPFDPNGTLTLTASFRANGLMHGTFNAYCGFYASRVSELSNTNFDALYGNITLKRETIASTMPMPLGLNSSKLLPLGGSIVNGQPNITWYLTNVIPVDTNVAANYSTTFRIDNYSLIYETFRETQAQNNAYDFHLFPVIVIDFAPDNTSTSFYQVSNINLSLSYVYNDLSVNDYAYQLNSFNESRPYYGSNYNYNTLTPSYYLSQYGNVNLFTFLAPATWFNSFWGALGTCLPIAITLSIIPFAIVLKALLK